MTNYTPSKNSFENYRPSKAMVDRLFSKAVDFHDRVIGTFWEWSQEAQLLNGEFRLGHATDLYMRLFEAYPEGTQFSVKCEDVNDSPDFNGKMRVRVEVPGKWLLAADLFMNVLVSWGEDDDERHDIDDIAVLLHLDASSAAEARKLEAWIDLQPTMAKAADLEIAFDEAA